MNHQTGGNPWISCTGGFGHKKTDFRYRKPFMIKNSDSKNAMIDRTISQRTGFGPNDMVKGWQSMLGNLLDHLASYLQPSHIVTFRQITPAEKQIFKQITERVEVPESACGVYLAPSARNQMLYTNQGLKIPEAETMPKDDGVLLFSRSSSHETILNVFLAHPPYAPAIDVYDRGALLAGYVYESIEECLNSVTHVITTHFGKS